jgi:hypothetical protein
MTQHKHYKAAYAAHYGTSFTPDTRAESWCRGFDETMAALAAMGVPPERMARYEALALRHLFTKSRCISTMIAGPANFPVARAEKANRAEHRACELMLAYHAQCVRDAKREAHYKAHPEARPVMACDADAVDRLKAQLTTMQANQAKMVQANKLARKGDRAGLAELLGEAMANELLTPGRFGGAGFAQFELTNNRANMKRIEERIADIEKRKATTPKDLTINGVRVVENTEAMRLQLFFPGKPSPAMIALLKGQAFKWAPSVQAWQRQLTGNAVYAFNQRVLPALKESEAANG